MRARPLGFHVVLGTILVQNGPPGGPRNPENQGFRVNCLQKIRFFIVNTDRQKEGQNDPQGLPPGRVKSRWEISPEAPRKITMNFFRPRGPPGASWEPPGEAPGAQLAPKRAPEASRSHFGTIWGANMEPRGLIFKGFLMFIEHFGVLFWSPSPVALLGLASVLISWPSLPGCFGSAVCLQKWGPPSGVHLSSFLSSSLACSWSLLVHCSLRRLHFESSKAWRPQGPSGRRGSRSD